MLIVHPLRRRHLRRRELNKLMLIILVNLHHTRLIPTPIAVVRRRPHRHQRLILEVIYVSRLDQLMCSSYGLEVVEMQELSGYFGWEEVACTTVANRPALDDSVRIRPHQVTHVTRLWDLPHSLDTIHLIQKWDIRRQPTMHAHQWTIYYCNQRQVVKRLYNLLPRIQIAILPLHLVIKSIYPSQWWCLVIAT